MQRVIPGWVWKLAMLLVSTPCSAVSYNMVFVDQNRQPIQFVVAVDPDAPKVTDGEVRQTPAIMDQVNMQFSPMVIAVEQGREVSFPNSDNIRHHVYSFSEAKRFETKLYANKPDSPVKFDQEGLVVLGCNIHDSMIGYIFISKTQAFDISDTNGRASILSQNPPSQINIWHPWSLTPNKIRTIKLDQWPAVGDLEIQLTIHQPKEKKDEKKKRFGNRW